MYDYLGVEGARRHDVGLGERAAPGHVGHLLLVAVEVAHTAPTLHVEDGHQVVGASSCEGLSGPVEREGRHPWTSAVVLSVPVEVDLDDAWIGSAGLVSLSAVVLYEDHVVKGDGEPGWPLADFVKLSFGHFAVDGVAYPINKRAEVIRRDAWRGENLVRRSRQSQLRGPLSRLE